METKRYVSIPGDGFARIIHVHVDEINSQFMEQVADSMMSQATTCQVYVTWSQTIVL